MRTEFLILSVLVLVYLAEGIWLAPTVGWVFRRSVFGLWRLTPSQSLPEIRWFRICFAGISPSNWSVMAQAAPFLLSPLGIGWVNPGLPGSIQSKGEERSWEPWGRTIKFERGERAVKVSGRLLARALDEHCAREWAAQLRALNVADPQDRYRMIHDQLEASLDIRETKRRWRRLALLSPLITMLGWLHLLLIFLIFPVLLICGAGFLQWCYLAAILLGNQIVLLKLYGTARKRIHPDKSFGSISLRISIFMSPPYLIRTLELLTMEMFSGLHPVAIAKVIMDRKAFLEVASTHLRAAHYPLDQSGVELQPDHSVAINLYREVLENWLRKQGEDIGTLLSVPGRDGVEVVCPRCATEYRKDIAFCSECTLPLQRPQV